MRRLALILALVLFLTGCQGSTYKGVQVVSVPQVGNAQTFDCFIYNYTQQDLLVIPTGSTQGVLLAPNTWVGVHIGFLPSSVTCDAQTTTIPTYYYASQTQVLGVDYNNFSTAIYFYYY